MGIAFFERTTMQNERFSGVFSAVCAYLIWGFLPIYWKLLRQAVALEILSHRVIWSLFFLLGFLLLTRRLSSFRNEIRAIGNERRRISGVFIATVIITLNWLVYIWAVNDNRIIETSLG